MLKSELLEKINNIADDADINETILGIEDFAKSSKFDIKALDLDGFKNVLEQNEIAKSYFTSQLDSGISKAVNSHDEKFKKEKLPSIIEEEIKKRDTSKLTPEQQQLRELQKQLDDMKAEKEMAELLNTNSAKLKEKGLDTGLAKYIKDEADIDFFSNLINNSVQDGVKAKLGGSDYKPPKTNGNPLGKISWEDVTNGTASYADYKAQENKSI
ncbi:MAG: DUF4355 domain-containing protein [Clostridium sp.]|uniref:capsid assembly scaffolding protein Gp46 family protein n=1 Tax=Clostridium sp. TaxID=1506 RepID=UPI00290312E7|nr:DUF4355 domain-containing protein [Clostridium sp.]MDU1603514.1 DUF4355 domain-containing protein [Clostridium sp.]